MTPPFRLLNRQFGYTLEYQKNGKKNYGLQMDFPVAGFWDIIFFEVFRNSLVKSGYKISVGFG